MTAYGSESIVVGRYVLHRPLARGGMATIHLAHLVGDIGFSRLVAAKRLLPELAENGEFVAMFLDEARVASKVHHRNVVPVLDVVTTAGEVVLVQEYVRGAPLSRLLQIASDARTHVPVPVAASIACQVLAGLQAAHETVDEMGTPLQVVHRDVSPQNIMVATDGTARLLDFGVAKAAMAAHVTRKGTFKGKLSYSAPEHIQGSATHQSDIYSLSVVLWELVTGQRLHRSSLGITKLIEKIMAGIVPTITQALADQRALISGYRWQQLEALEPIVKKGLAANPRDRWATAQEMEEAIAAAVPAAPGTEVSEWLAAAARDFLDERERVVAEEEASWRSQHRLGSPPLGELAIPVEGPSGPPHAVERLRAPRLRAWLERARAWLEPVRASLEQLPWPPELVTRGAALAGITLLGIAIAIALPRSHRHAAPAVAPAFAPPAEVLPAPALAPPGPHCAPPAVHAPPHAPASPPHHVVHVVRSSSSHSSHPESSRAESSRAESSHAESSRASRSESAHAASRSEAPPAPPRPAEKPHRSAPDCDPPYYFQGAKKIFKPACV